MRAIGLSHFDWRLTLTRVEFRVRAISLRVDSDSIPVHDAFRFQETLCFGDGDSNTQALDQCIATIVIASVPRSLVVRSGCISLLTEIPECRRMLAIRGVSDSYETIRECSTERKNFTGGSNRTSDRSPLHGRDSVPSNDQLQITS